MLTYLCAHARSCAFTHTHTHTHTHTYTHTHTHMHTHTHTHTRERRRNGKVQSAQGRAVQRRIRAGKNTINSVLICKPQIGMGLQANSTTTTRGLARGFIRARQALSHLALPGTIRRNTSGAITIPPVHSSLTPMSATEIATGMRRKTGMSRPRRIA